MIAQEIMSKNKVYKSFIGLGYYETLTPGVIQRNVRTAYTILLYLLRIFIFVLQLFFAFLTLCHFYCDLHPVFSASVNLTFTITLTLIITRFRRLILIHFILQHCNETPH